MSYFEISQNRFLFGNSQLCSSVLSVGINDKQGNQERYAHLLMTEKNTEISIEKIREENWGKLTPSD